MLHGEVCYLMVKEFSYQIPRRSSPGQLSGIIKWYNLRIENLKIQSGPIEFSL